MALAILFQISHVNGICVEKRSIKYNSCISIDVQIGYTTMVKTDALQEMQFYCQLYGCEWHFNEMMKTPVGIYGEGGCRGEKKKLPAGLCYGQPTKEACTEVTGVTYIKCRWLEDRRDHLYVRQYVDREQFDVFQPDFVKDFLKTEHMGDKYEMMVRHSFVRYSLDTSAKGGHKLELVRLTDTEINTVINAARTKPKFKDLKISTVTDTEPLNEYKKITDDTFSQFGGRIFLTYGSKQKPTNVWSGEATFVSEDKEWVTTSAHMVTNMMWLKDDDYPSLGGGSDDLSRFINLAEIPKVHMKTDPELFIVSPHLLKFIDSATIKSKTYKQFHVTQNEIGISEILVPLGYFLNDGNTGAADEFKSDGNTPLSNFLRNTDIAFAKLHIEPQSKRDQHRANHKHVVMKAYYKSQYAGINYDTFSYPPRGIANMHGAYSLWKHRISITDVYSHVLRKAEDEIDVNDMQFEPGQSGMCLLIHTGADEYELVGVYSGPMRLYSIGYHFTRISHITLKAFQKATQS
eukprot:236454_1